MGGMAEGRVWARGGVDDRHRSAALDDLHRELRVDAARGRAARRARSCRTPRRPRGRRPRRAHVVGQAEHAAALDDRVERGDPPLEASTVARSLSVSSTCTSTSKPRPDGGGVDVGVVAADRRRRCSSARTRRRHGEGERLHALGQLDVARAGRRPAAGAILRDRGDPLRRSCRTSPIRGEKGKACPVARSYACADHATHAARSGPRDAASHRPSRRRLRRVVRRARRGGRAQRRPGVRDVAAGLHRRVAVRVRRR